MAAHLQKSAKPNPAQLEEVRKEVALKLIGAVAREALFVVARVITG